MARSRYNDYGPLLELKRYEEAYSLLMWCREVFEAQGTAFDLDVVFSALGDLEARLGHHEKAVAHEETALRYGYLIGDPGDLAISHFNLALRLLRSGGSAAAAVGHCLAAAMICLQTADGHLPKMLRALSDYLDPSAPSAPLPANFEDLCRIVEQTEGVHFRELFERLPKTRAATGDEALRQVIQQAQALAAAPSPQPEV